MIRKRISSFRSKLEIKLTILKLHLNSALFSGLNISIDCVVCSMTRISLQMRIFVLQMWYIFTHFPRLSPTTTLLQMEDQPPQTLQVDISCILTIFSQILNTFSSGQGFAEKLINREHSTLMVKFARLLSKLDIAIKIIPL